MEKGTLRSRASAVLVTALVGAGLAVAVGASPASAQNTCAMRGQINTGGGNYLYLNEPSLDCYWANAYVLYVQNGVSRYRYGGDTFMQGQTISVINLTSSQVISWAKACSYQSGGSCSYSSPWSVKNQWYTFG